MGNLILGADFSKKPIAGWNLLSEVQTKFISGTPPQLQASFEFESDSPNVLGSSGFFDNLDLSITIKFLDGKVDWVYGGFYTRYSAEGGYGFLISAQSSYKVGYYSKGQDDKLVWKDLIGWTTHTALRSGLNEANRLRVICNGDRLKIYLNGVLASSIEDSRFAFGRLYVSFPPSKESNVVAAISDLQLREVSD